MNGLEFIIFLIITLSILAIIIVGSILLYRYQTNSLQIRLEKVRHEHEREDARIRTIAEYRSKILECIKSTKKEDYADKESYIHKIEEYLKTI